MNKQEKHDNEELSSFCLMIGTLTYWAHNWSGLHPTQQMNYRKIPKNSDTGEIAVIILKLEQHLFTTE